MPMGPALVIDTLLAPPSMSAMPAVLVLCSTMPPVPAVKLTAPPLALKAVPLPEPSSRMICPAPLLDCTTTVDAPAVVAGVAVLKVMLPVWFGSPMVIVPVEAVKMRPSSVEVRLMPATGLLLLPPISMGRDSAEDWMVTEVVVTGGGVTLVTVPELLLEA